MPRYYFDIDHNGNVIRDDVGTELPDVTAARREAIDVLPEIIRCHMQKDDRHILTAIVRDVSDAVVVRVVMSLTAEQVFEDA